MKKWLLSISVITVTCLALMADWHRYDVNNDYKINNVDFAEFAEYWGHPTIDELYDELYKLQAENKQLQKENERIVEIENNYRDLGNYIDKFRQNLTDPNWISKYLGNGPVFKE